MQGLQRDLDGERVMNALWMALEAQHGGMAAEVVGLWIGLEQAQQSGLERRQGRDETGLQAVAFGTAGSRAPAQQLQRQRTRLAGAGRVGQLVATRRADGKDGHEALAFLVLSYVHLLGLAIE